MSRIFLGYPPPKIKEFIVEHYGPKVDTTPLTFTSTGDSTILFGKCKMILDEVTQIDILVPADSQPTDDVKLEYSIDNGEWSNYTLAETINLSDGQTVSFRATDAGNTTINDERSNPYGDGVYVFLISDTGTVAASGNIQSLLDKTCQRTDVPAYCYYYMFYNCLALTQAPALPATTLANSCYYWMFSGCKYLTTAPALPATTLANNCYKYMFSYCTSLTQAPALPATTLADSCYYGMFTDCPSLTTAPALPATTLADSCYYGMFQICTSLTQAPALPATTLADSCYYGIFEACSSLKTASFPNLDKETVASEIVEKQSAFNYAASNIQATCLDGILDIN